MRGERGQDEGVSASVGGSDLTGTLLGGRYLLRERLGEGVFGAVYRAEERLLGAATRQVAIKLSHRRGMGEETAREQLADALLLAGAMAEMTDASARHHLVPVYDAGVAPEAGGRGYVAMEYVRGTTLETQFLAYRRVPAPLLTSWVRQVCLALRGLHALVPPLLHRDLKPDNVLVGLDRQVRVVDFGLAARLVEGGHVPGVAGTLAYMAPETSRGQSVVSSDLYSLGLLLYEGLTGRHPFAHLVPPVNLPHQLHGDWLYDARRGNVVEPPSRLNNTVTAQMDSVVLRCLEHDPARRFASATELLEALDLRPSPVSHGEAALKEAGGLVAAGDADSARHVLERALSAPPKRPDERFALLLRLGRLLTDHAEHAKGAARLHEAWRLFEGNRALLGAAEDRARLAREISHAYDRAGNRFQRDRFARVHDRLTREEGHA